MPPISEEEKRLLDLGELEKGLGLPQNFIKGIIGTGDDWSFIIKVSALLESAITHVVTQRLDCSELELPISKLSFMGQTGKLAFAEALGLIGSTEVRLLEVIYGIRNKVVHDVKDVGFNLSSYFKSDKGKDHLDKLTMFIFKFGRGNSSEASVMKGFKKVIIENPRYVFALFLTIILALTYNKTKYLKSTRLALRDPSDTAKYFAQIFRVK